MGTVALEEYELMKDAKYRQYVSAIDKALKAFENCEEWQDLISPLGKLIKVIKDYERFHIIPRRIKLSKRLAQCLHSDLPGGVHLKALETYDVIFKSMGTSRLSSELFLYSSGLFPLFASAKMNVKPSLLTIYETHFVPLGPRLLPGLSGFLNGVLPGLEDCSDHFARATQLLEQVSDGVGDLAFYGCLWECVAVNSAVRLPAINYTISHFNKKLAMEDQPHFVGTCVDTMVKALCCGIQDANPLVQRAALDLLILGFPMHNTQLVIDDMVRLVTAALSTILRWDKSLYRRVYAWLLGTDINTSSFPPDHPYIRKLTESDDDVVRSAVYFELYSKVLLIEGVKQTLNQTGSDNRPYRLLTSLLDREDIGPVIIESVLFDVFRVLYSTCHAEDKPDAPKRKSDILKSANLFFNSLGIWSVWQFVATTFDSGCQSNMISKENSQIQQCVVKAVGHGKPDIWEICEVTEFLLGIIPIEVSIDSPGEHLIELVQTFISLMNKYLDSFSPEQLFRCLCVCQSILKKLQPLQQSKTKIAEPIESETADVVYPAVVRSNIGKVSPSTGERSSSSSLSDAKCKELGLMLSTFIKTYQNFYVSFVCGGKIINGAMLPIAFDKLLKSNTTFLNGNDGYLLSLSKHFNAEENELEMRNDEIAQSCGDALTSRLLAENSEIWNECFDVASLMLVDVLLFSKNDSINDREHGILPPWMKSLLTCCRYLHVTPKLHLTAIKTLLDLLQSCETNHSDEEHITPLFSSTQIDYIQNKTTIAEVITETVWSHLGCLTSQQQITCIQLLYQALNTFTADDSVELFLRKELLNGDETKRLSSLKKFINLWTVGRQLQDGRNRKYFQSSLLKVLDNLLLPDNAPLRLQTEAWLSAALMRGDISRLLDPLLVLLLDPVTARLGIPHVSIQHSTPDDGTNDDDSHDDVSRVYAISSVDGNVIYHVTDDLTKKDKLQDRAKWKKEKDTANNQKVFAVTSLRGNGESKLRFVTEKNVGRDIELPRPATNHVSLFVNPFNATDDDDASLNEDYPCMTAVKTAKRFNSSTRQVELSIAPRSSNKTSGAIHEDELFDAHDGTDNIGQRIVNDILNTIVDDVVFKAAANAAESAALGVHPLHSHILLYCGVYDAARVMYAFKALKNILNSNPRLFLCCTATSGISNSPDLLVLLARHRKSVLGRSFEGNASSIAEYTSTYRSSMYLQVLVTVCLSYARSFYPNLCRPRLTQFDLEGNRQVQLTSIETLTSIFSELLPIVRDRGKGFSSYIAEVLTQCKVQKIVLHCTMASLSAIQNHQQSSDRFCGRTFTEEVMEFNDCNEQHSSLTEHSRAMQVQLLKLILALIKLEHHLDVHRTDSAEVRAKPPVSKDSNASLSDTSYSAGSPLPQQPMFFRAVVSALSIKGAMRYLHPHWTELITASLPYLGSALHQIVMILVNQLCICIEELATVYSHPPSDETLPPDYAVTQLEALTVLCHYCVLDSTQQPSPLMSVSSSNGPNAAFSGTNTSQILNNLVHVFTPLPLMQELHRDKNQHGETLLGIRKSVLSRMPRIIASLSSLWIAVVENSNADQITIWGSPRVVRSQILEFLSPVALHHGPCFLNAMAVVWHERAQIGNKEILSPATEDQEVLVRLLSSIRVMPIDTLVQTVHQALTQPPIVQVSVQDHSLELSLLELFLAYMKTCSDVQLKECWGSLLALFRDGLLLSPPALFLVIAILNEFVQRAPTFEEKKDQRDLQDITAKLVEACGAVAGACLEQTSWLRRNLLVKDLDSLDDSSSAVQATTLQHSVQAQLVLAQVLAPLLDVSYGSQEKEKVANLLIALMANVTPYLKTHQPKYASNFKACSQLLANLSGFPYTRKSWKKDAFELFMDASLFQMESDCLPYWSTIVDNLMTHDQTTFSDLMGRIPVAQGGFLFSYKEQEFEQRANMLKRLAFVIMCSETDQYHKSMRDIQDRLSDSLRHPQVVPSIHAQVFFCFRVLLLRMSPHYVTALWPIVISEMVQVFTNIEHELMRDTEEFSTHIRMMSNLDQSWIVNNNNGLHANNNPHWLLLTLAALKLLDLAVLLPAHHLPQFQMYRWAFVQDGNNTPSSNHQTAQEDFIPHVTRIAKLMDKKYGPCEMYVRPKEGQLLLTETQVDGLQHLHAFFHSLQARPKSNSVDMPSIEKNILKDFLS